MAVKNGLIIDHKYPNRKNFDSKPKFRSKLRAAMRSLIEVKLPKRIHASCKNSSSTQILRKTTSKSTKNLRNTGLKGSCAILPCWARVIRKPRRNNEDAIRFTTDGDHK